ncbi:MAG: hypothetical protein ABSC90_15150 [Acidimicrobiales bacterium]|jgi:type II secretory pathway pseudopilin PulG
MTTNPVHTSAKTVGCGRRRRSVVSERRRARGDEGLTLVELLVAFTCLIVLLTLVATALSTYLTAGTSVISSYSATDQLLPSSVTIQRLIRSEVEPAPTPATSSTTNSCAPAINVPCPPFVVGSTGTYSTTFYANIGDSNGPAKIVMAESTPTEASTAKFYTSVFTVTQYRACPVLATATSTCPVNSGCPFSLNSTLVCSWSSAGTVLVDVTNVVNGAATVGSPVNVNGTMTTTPLPDSTKPIFAYNTLDPYSLVYIPNDGGTPTSAGILFTNPGTCTAPSVDVNGNPTSENCDTDTIQSVIVDLEVEVPGAPIHENYFTVYRLSSSSYLYSPVVG